MQTRRAYAIGLAISGITLLAGGGCESTQPAQTTLPPPVQPQVVAQQPIVVMGDTPTNAVDNQPQRVMTVATPERLAKQAEDHARAIEALLAARDTDTVNPGVRVIRPAPPAIEPTEAPVTHPDPHIQPPVAPTPPAHDLTEQSPPTEVVVASMGSRANMPMRVTNDQPIVAEFKHAAQPSQIGVTHSGESLEQQLARRAREYPRDLASQLDYQLMLYARDEQVPRIADIAGLATEDREVLTALIDGLTNFRNGIRADNNLLMNRKIRPLVEMADRLRSRSDLSIPNAMLCKEVKGFGAYSPIESTRFEAGVPHKAIVYSEVENFASRLNDKNMWETQLEQQIVLYDDKGFPIWEDKVPSTDLCRNRRRDFFIARIITIPDKLNMGRYVLKVSVTDQQASRIAETSIPFSVVAK